MQILNTVLYVLDSAVVPATAVEIHCVYAVEAGKCCLSVITKMQRTEGHD